MILTAIIGGILAGLVIGVLLEEIIDWAEDIIRRTEEAIAAVLYGIRQTASAVFKIYTQDRYGDWYETTRRVPENEIPAELKNLRVGEKEELRRWV